MIKLILTSLVMMSFSFNSFAGGGSADTGGGNAVGNQLLDVFENEKTSTIDFTQLKTYQQVVKPLLENVESKVPGFTKLLLSGVDKKVWLFDSKPLSRKACMNSSMIEVAKDVVGCQSHLEVRLYKPWYDKVNAQQQAALIIHELLRGLSMKYRDNLSMNDQDITFLTRTLLQPEKYDENQLVDIFYRTSLSNSLAPYSAYVSLNQKVILPKYRETCMGNNRANVWQTHTYIAHVTMNGTYSEGERDVAFKIMNETQTWSHDEDYVRNLTCKVFNDYITKYQ